MSQARGVIVAAALATTVLAAACGSSGSTGTSTTTTLAQGSQPSSQGSQSSTGIAASSAASSATSSTAAATLTSNLCDILDTSTVSQVLGASVGACRQFLPEGTAGRCAWGDLTASTSLQLTAWTGGGLATRRTGWQLGFPAVGGVGQGAWSRGAISLGAKTNVVLYVDYGSFGIEFAVTAPTATVAMAVTLAQDIK